MNLVYARWPALRKRFIGFSYFRWRQKIRFRSRNAAVVLRWYRKWRKWFRLVPPVTLFNISRGHQGYVTDCLLTVGYLGGLTEPIKPIPSRNQITVDSGIYKHFLHFCKILRFLVYLCLTLHNGLFSFYGSQIYNPVKSYFKNLLQCCKKCRLVSFSKFCKLLYC